MSDSDARDRRRVGDATRQRIDELADGWGAPQSAQRAEGDTRHAAKLESSREPPAQPPAPPARPKRRSAPPPPPPPPRRAPARPSARQSGELDGDGRPVSAAGEIELPDSHGSHLAARTEPVRKTSEPGLREIATQHHASGGIRASGRLRDDDATEFAPPDQQFLIEATQHRRVPDLVPRQSGLWGDVSYSLRVTVARIHAAKTLVTLREQIDDERAARTERLLHVAKQTVADPKVDLTLVERARDQLTEYEETRSRRAGASAAADAEIVSLEQARADESKNHAEQTEALSGELSDIEDRLRPLQAEAAGLRKQYDELGETLDDIDSKIAKLKASLVSIRGPKLDPASVEADIASLRAERESVSAEQPAVTRGLETLEPKIAALEAAHTEAELAIRDIEERERLAATRTAERVEAVRARKTVEERAVSDVNAERDAALEELGESLTLHRPEPVASKLRSLDRHDMSIASLERRSLEISDQIRGIDRGAVVRGLAMTVALAVALTSVLAWLLLR